MAQAAGLAVFATSVGWCGLAWSALGVVGVQLPEVDEAATRGRLARRYPGASEQAPPPPIAAAVAGVQALLAGERRNLAEVAIDIDCAADFHRRVWEATRRIAPGETRSYGEVAAALGDIGLSREVGQALGRNPIPIIVPCHRVLAAGGRIGGFSAFGGVATKRRLLAIEAAFAAAEPDLFR